ncbi:hypothetical protein PsYK624_085250 [Phanerochaete sordida]|uniref:Uncharacterized protein n=1 Tax=Phanerochaete sordida TaxID=48140 RepID=A0A9P3GCQ8_9APHY|nr:hypothetical protein PsYK624_085250 [Phanerochaete sordida]
MHPHTSLLSIIRAALLLSGGVVLILANIVLIRTLVSEYSSELQKRPAPLSVYSFVEDDVPERLPLMRDRGYVLWSAEESVRFSIDGPRADEEWFYATVFKGAGNVNLGPNDRFFAVDLEHELHCLRRLRESLGREEGLTDAEFGHAEHCLSYLRQHILCSADETLEFGDSFARNHSAWRSAGLRVCRDPEAFFSAMSVYNGAWLKSSSRHLSTRRKSPGFAPNRLVPLCELIVELSRQTGEA